MTAFFPLFLFLSFPSPVFFSLLTFPPSSPVFFPLAFSPLLEQVFSSVYILFLEGITSAVFPK